MQQSSSDTTRIWWSNATFFVSVHIAALFGIYHRPLWSTSTMTLILTGILFQAATFGITVGYHRLYSHKAFRTGLVIRAILGILGASACQGSIKWWALRHRLHHRYTDDTVHDPYAATRGLLWSHMGWIFFKSRYERMNLIDSEDLNSDKVVNLQHKYYVPITLVTAFVAPVFIGLLWQDASGAFVWASLVKCLMVWHATFLINSAAHWDGVQPYSDEDTSRTNFILAVLTNGEGNHNFHSFPHDFRSGPTPFEWDPSKWLIMTLHHFGLATGLRRARQEDLDEAKQHMLNKHSAVFLNPSGDEVKTGVPKYPLWTVDEARVHAGLKAGSCLLILDGYVVDATTYLGEHPGGAVILRKYALRAKQGGGAEKEQDSADLELWRKATWAFAGGMNTHSRAAKRRLQEFKVAKIVEN